MKALINKFKSLSLGVRIIGLTLVIITLIVVVNNTVFISKHREAANQSMVEKASAARPLSKMSTLTRWAG